MSTGPQEFGQQPHEHQEPTAAAPQPGHLHQGQYHPGQYPPSQYPSGPQYAQAPQQPFDPRTPYLQQPPQQQYFASPMPGPVSYVIQAQSLKGVRGWLMFFVLWAGWATLWLGGQLVWVFNGTGALDTVFTPLLFLLSLTCVVTTAMELAIARWTFIGWAGAWFCYNVAKAIESRNGLYGLGDEFLQLTIITSGVFCGFVILYFVTSKRVKETLVKPLG